MRIALISDIHANLTALEAVLADIDKRSVDSLICLGDVATLGPQPKQVITRLRSLGCPCIKGNHESALLDLENIEDYEISNILLPTLRWGEQQLDPEDLDYLRSFKPKLELKLDSSHTLLCFHGSPVSNTDLILSTTPVKMLEQVFANEGANILVGGHSHIQMLRRHDKKLILNPGSVGSAFRLPFKPGTIPQVLPWAEYGILDLDQEILTIELRQIPFDAAAYADAVKSSGMPMRDK